MRNSARGASGRSLNSSLVTRHPSLLLWLTHLVLPLAALADGGLVRLSQATGPFVVTVFSAPTPLHAGAADFSVLVQSRETNQPVLDADVLLRFEPRVNGAAPLVVAATRRAATNKLLYVAALDLPAPGTWEVRVVVRHSSGDGEVALTVGVEPAAPPLVSFWPYFLFPPVAIALFALHQWLRLSRPQQKAGGV